MSGGQNFLAPPSVPTGRGSLQFRSFLLLINMSFVSTLQQRGPKYISINKFFFTTSMQEANTKFSQKWKSGLSVGVSHIIKFYLHRTLFIQVIHFRSYSSTPLLLNQTIFSSLFLLGLLFINLRRIKGNVEDSTCQLFFLFIFSASRLYTTKVNQASASQGVQSGISEACSF